MDIILFNFWDPLLTSHTCMSKNLIKYIWASTKFIEFDSQKDVDSLSADLRNEPEKKVKK